MLPFWRELPSMIYHSEHSKAKMDSCCPSCVRMNVIDAWGQFNHRNEGFTHFSYTMLQAAYQEQEIPNSFAMFRLPPDLELTQSDKHIMPEVLIYQTLRSIQDCFFFFFFGLVCFLVWMKRRWLWIQVEMLDIESFTFFIMLELGTISNNNKISCISIKPPLRCKLKKKNTYCMLNAVPAQL